MSLDPLRHAIYKINNTPWRSYPFRHLWVEDVFPVRFYNHIRDHLRTATRFEAMECYPHRQFSDDLPADVIALFHSPEWFMLWGQKARSHTIRWTRDKAGYELNPHTDHADKVFTALVYVPQVEDALLRGTSIYASKQPGLKSDGTYKHDRAGFDLVYTFPFKPNCLLGIVRTDDSWHGVEPYVGSANRDMLFYTINR